MDSEQKWVIGIVAGVIIAISLIIGTCIWIDWYRSGLQSTVYKRNGIEMTQWEVFMGITAPEKVLQLKPAHEQIEKRNDAGE